MVGLDWVLKIQDWIWIAKYDSPLISDVGCKYSISKQSIVWGVKFRQIKLHCLNPGAELGEFQGGHCPQKFCLVPQKFSAWRRATALKLFKAIRLQNLWKTTFLMKVIFVILFSFVVRKLTLWSQVAHVHASCWDVWHKLLYPTSSVKISTCSDVSKHG